MPYRTDVCVGDDQSKGQTAVSRSKSILAGTSAFRLRCCTTCGLKQHKITYAAFPRCARFLLPLTWRTLRRPRGHRRPERIPEKKRPFWPATRIAQQAARNCEACVGLGYMSQLSCISSALWRCALSKIYYSMLRSVAIMGDHS